MFEEDIKVIPESVIELTDEIENLFNNSPKDKRKKKEVEAWKAELNNLIRIVNKKADLQLYKPIK
jgi:hypothetical protein